MRTERILAVLVVALALAVTPACSSKKKATTLPDASAKATKERTAKQTAANEGAKAGPDTGGAEITGGGDTFGPIYFDYDTATLTAESRDVLEALARHLDKNPSVTVVIAGHADERGTPEYNIALGDERAQAAAKYLIRLGVDKRRIKTVSYGEERPAVSGDDESAWARNRRDEFELSGGARAGR